MLSLARFTVGSFVGSFVFSLSVYLIGRSSVCLASLIYVPVYLCARVGSFGRSIVLSLVRSAFVCALIRSFVCAFFCLCFRLSFTDPVVE